MTPLQAEIETRVAAVTPDVEVLLAELSGETLRVYIDRPDGVTLEVCERVTGALGDLREKWAIEVSSPGPRRPLTKPEHFRRFIGRRARVATEPGAVGDERHTLTGELVGASAQEVTLAAPDGLVAIPYDAIKRSHLVEE